MTTYILTDDQGITDRIQALDIAEARQRADEWVREYADTSGGTLWETIGIWSVDAAGNLDEWLEDVTVTVQPEEPECSESERLVLDGSVLVEGEEVSVPWDQGA